MGFDEDFMDQAEYQLDHTLQWEMEDEQDTPETIYGILKNLIIGKSFLKDTPNKACSEENLKKVGLNKETAAEIHKRLEKNSLYKDYTSKYWAIKHLEYELKYNENIKIKQSKNAQTNKSIKVSSPQTQGNKTLAECTNLMKLTEHDRRLLKGFTQFIKQTDMPMTAKEIETNQHIGKYLDYSRDANNPETTKFWFHATDIKSAIEITEEGIKLEKGNKGLEYSNEGGFYITNDISYAIQLAETIKERKNSAIVVFKNIPAEAMKDTKIIKDTQEKGEKAVNEFWVHESAYLRALTEEDIRKSRRENQILPYQTYADPTPQMMIFGPTTNQNQEETDDEQEATLLRNHVHRQTFMA